MKNLVLSAIILISGIAGLAEAADVKIKEVTSKKIQALVPQVYWETREEADCCGVSDIYHFRTTPKAATFQVLTTILSNAKSEVLAKGETREALTRTFAICGFEIQVMKDPKTEFKSLDVNACARHLLESRDGNKASQKFVGLFDGEPFSQNAIELTLEINALVNRLGAAARVDASYETNPYPNVDGRVGFIYTEKGEGVLIAYDYGA